MPVPGTDSDQSAQRRRYVRLSSEQWAEARAAWVTGGVTAEELARRYGCSLRAIQLHMLQHKAEKGSALAKHAAAVEARVLAEALPSNDDLATRIRETREATYANATAIQQLVMNNVQLAQDPTTALGAVAALRALDLAAAALGRTQRVRWLALGLDKALPASDELPELLIREMSAEEVIAIRDQQHRDDAELNTGQSLAEDDDDNRIEEGDDDPPLPAAPETASVVTEDAALLNESGRIGGSD